MTTSQRTPEGRERQAWRLPVALVQFLRHEAKAHDNDLTHFVIRIFGAYETYYDLHRGAVVALERDRAALRMRRWDYLAHALAERARMIAERGVGFDAPGTVRAQRAGERARIRVERWSTGAKMIVSWFLPADLRKFLRKEAELQGWDYAAFATALLNSYAGFFPLPEARAERLERDRRATGLNRWDYFRHLWSQREELVAAQGPGFDAPNTTSHPPGRHT